MPKRRAIDTDYSRHTIEDRPEEVDSLRFLDEDGNLVEGGDANPLPIEIESSITEDIRNSLDVMICEQRKTNEYLAILTGVNL